MLNIDTLREEFDNFLSAHNGEMTDAEVVKKALETENEMFKTNKA